MTVLPPRQPVFNIPLPVVLSIAVLAGIEGVRALLPDRLDADLLARFAFVPGRFTYAFDPGGVAARWAGLNPSDPAVAQAFAAARFLLGNGSVQPWTVLTYALLHGGWAHVGLNALWLLAFGTPVARRLGAGRFLLFLAVGAAVGAAAQYGADPFVLQPVVGASAAVSACMAGALRFMFRPARPDADAPSLPPERLPLQSVVAVFRDRRSLGFIVVWFLTNALTGVAAVPLGMSEGPIAWQAHIGGFLLGLLAFGLFDRAPAPDG